ncbi:response regulator [Sphingobium yanoikuyae]|jgi:two-component system, LuxR family, response regulator FixJ|uniref:DNA-binding response regulator n=9 Tax=Sphingomonadaceae TaxID=41297 RepID=A0A2A4FVI2_9SPHN|nr:MULTISPECIES: response regulator [Sphingomonadaceae]MAP62245.1 DNA-binding response regulator [Microbacterium sp.]MCF8707198.1 response regulator [Rhizorhapis sp. SPR117]MEA3388210.1 response regulator [Pseudomonadota bacterium]ATE67837.1 DNA-binding response regulator [Rhizorhabdus dicambivorans]KEQ54727.1 Two component transcriptional regulator, LuxR family [Sphingobium chlorophenolicum]|tara:strand:+ start:1134 stop:1754 length:621 start_codon:yes stop_codon:yes gene_type:complete
MESKRVVHVIDDEETIRKAVGFTLRTAGFAVETYGSGVDFLKIADEAERGSIVLDMHMPDMNGLQVQAALTQMDISMPVVMLTGNGDIALAVQAMKAGAVDFLAKPIERALLLDAIDRAFARIDTAEGRALEEAEACRQVDLLTPRERDVLEGLAQGLPNKTIAYDLGISSRTVEVHRASIMSKLGVRTLAETLRIAFAAGMGRPL